MISLFRLYPSQEDVKKNCSRLLYNLLYRDVKDENIIIDTHTDEVKLIDFGSGCGLRSDWYTHFSGTLLYAPPEWIRDHRSGT